MFAFMLIAVAHQGADDGGDGEAMLPAAHGVEFIFGVRGECLKDADGDDDILDGAKIAEFEQAADGTLYGTTAQGGAASFGVCEYGCGTVFEVTSEGKLKTLATFDITDGDFPVATLLLADETLYGTTQGGGVEEGKPGTVFKFAPVASSPVLQSAP